MNIFHFAASHCDSQVPFALGKIIDLIYSLDQLKTGTEEEQKALINDRLKKVRFRGYISISYEPKLMKVCLGLSGIFILGGLCNFGRIYLMRVSIAI